MKTLKKTLKKSFKKTISLLLCAAMLIVFLPTSLPKVSALENKELFVNEDGYCDAFSEAIVDYLFTKKQHEGDA
jgi:hypothetical protein